MIAAASATRRRRRPRDAPHLLLLDEPAAPWLRDRPRRGEPQYDVAAVMADAGCDVTVWGRDERRRQIADEHRNEKCTCWASSLPRRVTATTDVRAAVRGADVVAVAVPSPGRRAPCLSRRARGRGLRTVVVSP